MNGTTTNGNIPTYPVAVEDRLKDCLIVALDVPTCAAAAKIVEQLDNVCFFKIGIQLFLEGDFMGFLKRIHSVRGPQGEERKIFIDLKIAGDIPSTIKRFVDGAMDLGIHFITITEASNISITEGTLAAGRNARDNAGQDSPQFLLVPALSSTDASPDEIVLKGKKLIEKGADGLIVSGNEAIKSCRKSLDQKVVLVSPGIRPVGCPADEHVRWTTPGDAIRAGSNYVVVGRPIINADDKRAAAQRVIDEIQYALAPVPS